MSRLYGTYSMIVSAEKHQGHHEGFSAWIDLMRKDLRISCEKDLQVFCGTGPT